MFIAFLIVAVILFVLAAIPPLNAHPWAGSMVPLGLAFFAASFLVGKLG